MEPKDLKNYVVEQFDSVYLPVLKKFIEIPNLSPFFDPDLSKQFEAANLFLDFSKKLGYKTDMYSLPGKSPILIVTIPATKESIKENILLYGHMDKQPYGQGWDLDKGPTKPVVIDGKLYGRGSADDGYAFFASLLAVKAIENFSQDHGTIHILIESDEESGSGDLYDYMDDYIKVIKINFSPI
jgi:acetylornithine deacetylase/succinyl-diaminopimelate desuccinylase-like protein